MNIFVKNRIFLSSFGLLAFFGLSLGLAQGSELTPVNIFVRENCQHCQAEEAFLQKLLQERKDFKIIKHDLAEAQHREHFRQLTELERLPRATPLTLVGNVVLQGFDSERTTGQRIRELLDASQGKATLDFADFLAAGGSQQVETFEEAVCEQPAAKAENPGCEVPQARELIEVPFLGVIDLGQVGLVSGSALLGFIDGFNPCAMWVLVTFLLVLMQLGDRRKIWKIAGLFILAEAVMYFLILNFWFLTWDFVGLDQLITPLVGLVAVGGGLFFLWEGLTSEGTCKVTNAAQRQKISQQIKELAHKPLTWVVAAGVVGLAFSVNIIEFACSIGIPQAFTKILDLNNLTLLVRELLVVEYTFFYMLDDVIVFGLAIWGLEHLALTQQYSKYCNLLGGVLMVLIGGVLFFAPELLRFG